MKNRVYAWLGYWRDKIPAEAVSSLQDILGELNVVVEEVKESPEDK